MRQLFLAGVQAYMFEGLGRQLHLTMDFHRAANVYMFEEHSPTAKLEGGSAKVKYSRNPNELGRSERTRLI